MLRAGVFNQMICYRPRQTGRGIIACLPAKPLKGMISEMSTPYVPKRLVQVEGKRASFSGEVVIIGPFPPLIGGNSIHVQRLALGCISRGLRCKVIDPYSPIYGDEPEWLIRFRGGAVKRFALMLIWLLLKPYQVVHIHTSALDRFALVGWLVHWSTLKANVKVITIHSGSFIEKVMSRGPLARNVVRSLLRPFDYVIVVNEDQRKFLEAFLNIDSKKIRVIPAYIPLGSITTDLPEVVSQLRKHAFVIVGSGCATPLYAHELLVEVVARFQEEGLDVGLVIAVYSRYEEPYFGMLKQKIDSMSNVILVKELNSEEFNKLLEIADLYVRTARFDGDSISVREALDRGCPVVASDCVPRPEGCETFITDDAESLYMAIKRILQSRGKIVSTSTSENYLDDVTSVYGICLKNDQDRGMDSVCCMEADDEPSGSRLPSW